MEARNSTLIQDASQITPDQIRKTAALFSALGDETRLQIMLFLLAEPHTVNEIADHIGITLSAISHQLKKLYERDLVRFVRKGPMKYFQIADTHIRHLMNDGLVHATNVELCQADVECNLKDKEGDF